MFQSAIRTFKLYDTDAVRAAAMAAAESLGHAVETENDELGEIVIKTAKSETTKAGKKMRVNVSTHQGVTTAMVTGAMFFGQKRTLEFGQQLFEAMDVILAS